MLTVKVMPKESYTNEALSYFDMIGVRSNSIVEWHITSSTINLLVLKTAMCLKPVFKEAGVCFEGFTLNGMGNRSDVISVHFFTTNEDGDGLKEFISVEANVRWDVEMFVDKLVDAVLDMVA